jgi:hypothetical protein
MNSLPDNAIKNIANTLNDKYPEVNKRKLPMLLFHLSVTKKRAGN